MIPQNEVTALLENINVTFQLEYIHLVMFFISERFHFKVAQSSLINSKEEPHPLIPPIILVILFASKCLIILESVSIYAV